MKKQVKKEVKKPIKKTATKKVVKKASPKKTKQLEQILPEANTPINDNKQSVSVILPTSKPKSACILKIKVGTKYYIAKTHNILWLGHEIEREIVKFQNDKAANLNKLYAPIVMYAVTKRLNIVFDVLFESESGYKCMKFELEQLEKDFGKKGCLNQNNIPHIPKTILTTPNKPPEKKPYVWLTPNDEINFRKLLSKYDY